LAVVSSQEPRLAGDTSAIVQCQDSVPVTTAVEFERSGKIDPWLVAWLAGPIGVRSVERWMPPEQLEGADEPSVAARPKLDEELVDAVMPGALHREDVVHGHGPGWNRT